MVQFVHRWVLTIRQAVFDDNESLGFIEELAEEVEADCMKWSSLQEEASLMHHVMSQLRRYQADRQRHSGQKWKLPPCGQPICLFSSSGQSESRTIIRPDDDSKIFS